MSMFDWKAQDRKDIISHYFWIYVVIVLLVVVAVWVLWYTWTQRTYGKKGRKDIETANRLDWKRED